MHTVASQSLNNFILNSGPLGAIVLSAYNMVDPLKWQLSAFRSGKVFDPPAYVYECGKLVRELEITAITSIDELDCELVIELVRRSFYPEKLAYKQVSQESIERIGRIVWMGIHVPVRT